MIKPILLLILGIIFSLLSYGQNDYINYNLRLFKARKLAYENKLDSALLIYKQSFDLVEYIHIKNLKAAQIIANELNDKVFYEFTTKKINDFYNNLNLKDSYRIIIDSLSKEDKRVRGKEYNNAKHVYYKYIKDSLLNKDSNEFKIAENLMKEWRHIDSTNIQVLLSLISKYGYPSERIVGEQTYGKAFMILLHFDKDEDNSILKPIIDKALHEGNIDPEDYSWIVDRRLSWCQGKPQFYYHMLMETDNLSEEEINEINERRKKIGLRKLFEGIEIKNDDMSITIKKLY